MSTVQQIVSLIIEAERQIDDQINRLTTFSGELDQVSQKVDAVLSGSNEKYLQQMIQQVSATKKQVDDTILRLRQAKDKLETVKLI